MFGEQKPKGSIGSIKKKSDAGLGSLPIGTAAAPGAAF